MDGGRELRGQRWWSDLCRAKEVRSWAGSRESGAGDGGVTSPGPRRLELGLGWQQGVQEPMHVVVECLCRAKEVMAGVGVAAVTPGAGGGGVTSSGPWRFWLGLGLQQGVQGLVVVD